MRSTAQLALSLVLFFFLFFFSSSSPLLRADNPSPEGPIPTRGMLLPEGITSFGAATHEDWLYVYGGHIGRTHEYSTETVSGDFRRLNLLDRATWEELPDGPPLQGVALVTHGAFLYRVGGLSVHNARGAPKDLRSVALVERYDPMGRLWEALTPLPEARSSHDALVIADDLYVVGGWTLSGAEDKKWHTTLLRAKLASDKLVWESLPAAPFEARGMAAVGCAGKLFVIGGMTSDEELSRNVHVYDPAQQTWTRGPDLPAEGFGVAAAAMGESVLAAGADGSVLRLTGGSSWAEVTRLAFPRIFARLLPVSSRELVIVGGTSRNGKARALETIQLDAIGPVAIRFSLPYPSSAKSRQGAVLEGGKLHLFGGNRSLKQHDFGPQDFLDAAFSLDLSTFRLSRDKVFPKRLQSVMTVDLPADAAARKGPSDSTATRRFAIGGFAHDGQVARSQSEIFEWSSEALEWRKAAIELPRPRTQGALVAWGGKIWVFGGMDYDPRREESPFQYELDVLRWDPSVVGSSFEATGHKLPVPRRAFAWAVLDDKLYLLGGLGEKFAQVSSCDVFDFKEQRWEKIPAPRHSRISPEGAALGGKIYLAGGLTARNAESPRDFLPDSSIEVYDPVALEWRTEALALPIPAEHARMAAWNQSLLFWSTYSSSANAIEVAIVRPQITSSAKPSPGD